MYLDHITICLDKQKWKQKLVLYKQLLITLSKQIKINQIITNLMKLKNNSKANKVHLISYFRRLLQGVEI